MDGKKLLFWGALCVWAGLASASARAAVVELSGLISYGTADFADGYKSTQRRYTGSIDFKFTAVSALEFEYTDSTTKVSYPTNVGAMLPYYTQEATTYRDKIYSFNWVQNLVSSKWIIQPYVVIGGGKMQRKLTKEYPELGLKDTAQESTTTGTAGAGIRIFLTRNMALKGEFKTYVPKFHFAQWKENQLLSGGLSWLF